jgi:hypothetical protein
MTKPAQQQTCARQQGMLVEHYEPGWAAGMQAAQELAMSCLS